MRQYADIGKKKYIVFRPGACEYPHFKKPTQEDVGNNGHIHGTSFSFQEKEKAVQGEFLGEPITLQVGSRYIDSNKKFQFFCDRGITLLYELSMVFKEIAFEVPSGEQTYIVTSSQIPELLIGVILDSS
jgi:hypothetical protein